jgi:hypothetical protein
MRANKNTEKREVSTEPRPKVLVELSTLHLLDAPADTSIGNAPKALITDRAFEHGVVMILNNLSEEEKKIFAENAPDDLGLNAGIVHKNGNLEARLASKEDVNQMVVQGVKFGEHTIPVRRTIKRTSNTMIVRVSGHKLCEPRQATKVLYEAFNKFGIVQEVVLTFAGRSKMLVPKAQLVLKVDDEFMSEEARPGVVCIGGEKLWVYWSRIEARCHYCHKIGHWETECQELLARRSSGGKPKRARIENVKGNPISDEASAPQGKPQPPKEPKNGKKAKKKEEVVKKTADASKPTEIEGRSSKDSKWAQASGTAISSGTEQTGPVEPPVHQDEDEPADGKVCETTIDNTDKQMTTDIAEVTNIENTNTNTQDADSTFVPNAVNDKVTDMDYTDDDTDMDYIDENEDVQKTTASLKAAGRTKKSRKNKERRVQPGRACKRKVKSLGPYTQKHEINRPIKVRAKTAKGKTQDAGCHLVDTNPLVDGAMQKLVPVPCAHDQNARSVQQHINYEDGSQGPINHGIPVVRTVSMASGETPVTYEPNVQCTDIPEVIPGTTVSATARGSEPSQ